MPPIEPIYVPPTTVATSTAASEPVYLTPTQQQALAEQYAPILYFHPEEQNFLQDPNTFLAESTLVREVDGYVDRNGVHERPDETLYGRGEVPPEVLAQIPESNEDADAQLYLDHRNEDLGDGVRDGDLDSSRTLYQYDPETKTITYHLFYAFNDGPPGVGDVQNHEGDWERITVQLDENAQLPVAVRYSAHKGLSSERAWADAPTEDGRPVAYIGQGSHASYPEPGVWATNAQIKGVPLVNDVAETGGVRFDLAGQPMADVTQEAWYGSHVLWGERGTPNEVGVGDFSGPTGPSPSKGPVTNADPDREPLSGLDLLPQFFTHDAPEKIGDAYRATEGFVTETLPAALDAGWDATTHFVTDTVPGAIEGGWNATEYFATDTVPGAVEDGWNATEGFVSDRLSDGAGVVDDLVPDEFPSISMPDVDVPDIDIPDPRDIDIPGL